MTLNWRTIKAHRFSIAIGGGVLLTLLLWGFWILRIPTLEVQTDWLRRTQELSLLRTEEGKIPSPTSLSEFRDYRKWLDDQARQVRDYFRDRTLILESNIPTGSAPLEQMPAAAFKDAYFLEVKNAKASLTGSMSVPDIEKAFVQPKWFVGPTMPTPSEYRPLVRDLGARIAIYKLCSSAGVRAINRFDLRQTVSVSDYFDGLPLDMEVLVPADRVYSFVSEFLRVSPRSPRPIFAIKRLVISPREASRLCSVSIEGYTLMLKDNILSLPEGGRP